MCVRRGGATPARVPALRPRLLTKKRAPPLLAPLPADRAALEQAFGAHGNLLDAVVIMDRDDPSRSRGFGFVKFEKEADMKAAIEVRGARLAARARSTRARVVARVRV